MNYSILRSQIKRHSSDFLEFNSLLREHNLLIPAFDFFDLVDIRLRFYAQPSFQPLIPAQSLFGVKDLRFYINGVDHTKYLKADLKYIIRLADKSRIKKQYKEGALSWIKFMEQYKDSWSINIETEKETLNKLLSASNFDEQLKVLGDKSYGFGGNLHLINYIYKDIALESLSLKRIINYRQKELGKSETDFSSFENIRLTIAQGPAPSFESFDAINTQPRGRMFYFLEYIYNNPVEELLQVILKKITDTQNWVELQRINYLEPLKNQVDVLETETKAKFEEYKLRIDNLSKIIQDNFPNHS